MKQKQTKLTGKEGFEKYYQDLYGSRWQDLKNVFQKENQTVEYFVSGAQTPYYLDSASVFAALCLPLNTAEIFWICVRLQVEKQLFLLPEWIMKVCFMQMNVLLPEKLDCRILLILAFLWK